MKTVHLANTDFEFELACSKDQPIELEHSWSQHPLCLQLQFLPLLYALPGELVAVTSYPPNSFLEGLQGLPWRRNAELPTLALLQEARPFADGTCLSWGPSRKVQAWALQRRMAYVVPADWEMIKDINSKAFSFRYSPLKESALLANAQDLEYWLKNTPGTKVLKACFGLSGKGNRIIRDELPMDDALALCHKEWREGRPVIAEPWLDKCFDFSTQWIIHPDGRQELLGATVFETDLQGAYRGTLAGPAEKLFGAYSDFLKEHQRVVRNMLKELFKKGFFGPVGVDALLYNCRKIHKTLLYPIVEINARETMSLIALRLQQRWFPEQTIRLSFAPQQDGRPSLLPLHIHSNHHKGGVRAFKRKLVLEVQESDHD